MKNLYPPDFSQPTYTFQTYRYVHPGTLIGTISASDRDEDPHNSHFTIYAAPRQSSTNYVTVTTAGDVILASTPPRDLKSMRVMVMAKDDGSPSLTSNTTVVVILDEVKR